MTADVPTLSQMATTTDTRYSALDTVLGVLSLCLVGVVLRLTLGPVPDEAALFPQADKLFHAGSLGLLAFLLLLVGVWRPGRGAGWWPAGAWWIVGGSALFGVLIEVAQSFLSRDADVFDALADLMGTLIALWSLLKQRAAGA